MHINSSSEWDNNNNNNNNKKFCFLKEKELHINSSSEWDNNNNNNKWWGGRGGYIAVVVLDVGALHVNWHP